MVELMERLTSAYGTVAAWKDGRLQGRSAQDVRFPDVMMHCGGGCDGAPVENFYIVTLLVPELFRWVDVGGPGGTVQTFRYVSTDGEVRRLLYCGECGDVVIANERDLQTMGLERCRRCDAVASLIGCSKRHAFGRCSSCQPSAVGVP